jgi:hypothetical protein
MSRAGGQGDTNYFRYWDSSGLAGSAFKVKRLTRSGRADVYSV